MKAYARRTVRAAIPLLQLTAAATLAWIIALKIGGHDDPFFAPIAVVVALSSPLGERGSNAVRILLGVMIGIVAGELTVLVLGEGYGRLALATLSAMAVAKLVGGPRLVMVQAAAAAILTVAAAGGEAGIHRLIDGAIGAGVTLVFSQILFSPEPVALVRRAAAAALSQMAVALRLTADALEHHESAKATEAITLLRSERDRLTELARLRKASSRVARRSAIWRYRMGPTVKENENAGHLDVLSSSCLLLARVAEEAIIEEEKGSAQLAPSVCRLAEAVGDMARAPGDQAIRQAAVDHAIEVARSIATDAPSGGVVIQAAVLAVQLVTVDVMVVAGVEPDEATLAARQGSGDFQVPAPPKAVRRPSVPRPFVRRPPRGDA